MIVQKKRLGELVLRSEEPEALVKFYHEVIGLELFAAPGTTTFLKVADDLEGHPQLLVIFDSKHAYSGPRHMKSGRADSRSGTLHHFAFALEAKDFALERERLQNMNVALAFDEHPAFGWRSIYMHDPDGNSVELVFYDASILNPDLNRRVLSAIDR
ncbi:VOC family protein [Pontiella agarivorans]|uniref:VOC family protein n=1 Tax=Pontiella agarivorans TaxID=3038953 RepID=A0ABU5MZW3_9BACT|nr:VOC family protein [Pontiella agarivorans]MDZ8119501.1 VOC family protein [Pontiella agarivorans]